MNIVFWLTTKLLDASHTEGRSKSTAGSRYRNDNPIALIDIAVGSVRQAPLLLMLLIRSVVMALAENLFNELHCRRYQLKVVLMERLKNQCFFLMRPKTRGVWGGGELFKCVLGVRNVDGKF